MANFNSGKPHRWQSSSEAKLKNGSFQSRKAHEWQITRTAHITKHALHKQTSNMHYLKTSQTFVLSLKGYQYTEWQTTRTQLTVTLPLRVLESLGINSP